MKTVNIEATIVDVAVAFSAKPGDKLVIVQGVAISVIKSGETSPEPAKVFTRSTPRSPQEVNSPALLDKIMDVLRVQQTPIGTKDIADKLGIAHDDKLRRGDVSRAMQTLMLQKRIMSDDGPRGYAKYIAVNT